MVASQLQYSGLPPWSRLARHPLPLPRRGSYPYKRDLENLEFHLLDTGHFALEEKGGEIAELIRSFLDRNVSRQP